VLLAWRDEAASMATLRRKAEQLRTEVDAARLAQCWREWRCHVENEKRSRELLRRGESQLAYLRRAQVCDASQKLQNFLDMHLKIALQPGQRTFGKACRCPETCDVLLGYISHSIGAVTSHQRDPIGHTKFCGIR